MNTVSSSITKPRGCEAPPSWKATGLGGWPSQPIIGGHSSASVRQYMRLPTHSAAFALSLSLLPPPPITSSAEIQPLPPPVPH